MYEKYHKKMIFLPETLKHSMNNKVLIILLVRKIALRKLLVNNYMKDVPTRKHGDHIVNPGITSC